jgi:hypothetical protein
MKIWSELFVIAVVISASLIILPVSGGLFTIPQGGTAFIGEQGLDITTAGVNSATKIGWFDLSANITTDAPTATVTVDDAKNFFVDPAVFASKTGAWYTIPDKHFAFYVQDPSLKLRVFDDTANIDVTNSSGYIVRGDQASFRIETNLMAMLNRSGITMVPVTIYVLTPGGAQLAEISGHPLTNIGVTSSPFSTGPIWDTRQYPSGTYTVWAICDVNKMNDNYRVDGKTQTPQTGNVQVQSSNPLVTATITPASTNFLGPSQSTSGATTTSSPVQTTTIQTTTEPPTTLPTTTTPAATQSPGPEFVLVCAGLVGAGLLLGKRISR